jgi:hypothetical protein
MTGLREDEIEVGGMAARRKLAFFESRALSSTEPLVANDSASAYAEAFGLDLSKLVQEIRSEFTPASVLAQVDSPERSDS